MVNCGDVITLWINAGIQELISYRVNFILYRIGDAHGMLLWFFIYGRLSLIPPRSL